MIDRYLAHHGIKGQKWGVRRYQNADGSYTEAGLKRYVKNVRKDQHKFYKEELKKDKEYQSQKRKMLLKKLYAMVFNRNHNRRCRSSHW